MKYEYETEERETAKARSFNIKKNGKIVLKWFPKKAIEEIDEWENVLYTHDWFDEYENPPHGEGPDKQPEYTLKEVIAVLSTISKRLKEIDKTLRRFKNGSYIESDEWDEEDMAKLKEESKDA